MNPPRVLRSLPVLLLLALLLVPPGAAYTPIRDAMGNALEPDPYIKGNVTITNHRMEKCMQDVLCFEDDQNAVRNLGDYGFEVNRADVLRPLQVRPQSVDCSYYNEDIKAPLSTSAWCANVSDVSWLDVSKWTTASMEGNETIAREWRNGAHVLHVRNPGGTDGSAADNDVLTLDFGDITADLAKTRLVIGVEVASISNNVVLQVYDTNGTGRSEFAFSPSASTKAGPTGSTFWLMNGTGVTFWDPLLSEANVASTGGITRGIGKLELNLYAKSATGPADLYIYALGLQVKRHVFGQDELGNDVYNMTYAADGTAPGYVGLHTFAPSFTYTNLQNLRVAYLERGSTLPPGNVVTDDQAEQVKNDPTYSWQINYRFRFQLPKMADLTYAGDETVASALPVPGVQYVRLMVNGQDHTKAVQGLRAGVTYTSMAPGTVPVGTTPFEYEATVKFTTAQRDVVTEVGWLWFSPGGAVSKGAGWLAGIFGVGGAVWLGFRRQRKA